jgi:hypothetical protein
MKVDRLLYIMAFIINAVTVFAADAPVERFLIEPNKIHPDALKGILGVMHVTFVELDYYIHFSPPPAEIQGFERKEGEPQVASLKLSLTNTKPLSGIDWSQMVVRRFPISQKDGRMVEIVYDLEKNLRIWVQTADDQYVRTTMGQLVSAGFTWFHDRDSLTMGPDIFYLLNGKPRRFFESPDNVAAYHDVNNDQQINQIPFRPGKDYISTFEITEIKNGFAKISTRSGADGDLKFAGWIKIFDNGVLTIWPVASSGC